MEFYIDGNGLYGEVNRYRVAFEDDVTLKEMVDSLSRINEEDKKEINLTIESNELSIEDVRRIGQMIEKSIPKDIKVKFWGYIYKKA